MNTFMLNKRHQHHHRLEARWPVTVITPNGQIEGETENVSPLGMVISSLEPPPVEGSFRVLIRPPNRNTLSATARSVWTAVDDVGEEQFRLSTEIHFDSISDADRNFLRKVIARHYESKISSASQGPTSEPCTSPSQKSKPAGVPQIADVRIPVYYNHEGKTLEASGTRFSTRGCHMYCNTAPPAGAVFSLKITNPRTGKSMQVDSSVIVRKKLMMTDSWVMILRFMNLSEADKDEIRQILKDGATAQKSEKARKPTIKQAIFRYLQGKGR